MAWCGTAWVTRLLEAPARPRRAAVVSLPCTLRRPSTPGPTPEGGSDQAVPRHPSSFAECCFLPDLTRFAIRRCAGPDPQRRLEGRPPYAGTSGGNSALL